MVNKFKVSPSHNNKIKLYLIMNNTMIVDTFLFVLLGLDLFDQEKSCKVDVMRPV